MTNNHNQTDTTSMQPEIINSLEEIKKIDQSNVLGSIEALADQIKHGWKEANAVQFTPSADIKNVVVTGMGGSGLGPDVARHLFKEKLVYPLEVINSYSLPGYVDQHTLVILSSYSGNTEEVLSCAQKAIEKDCQLMAITSGGKLQKITQDNDIPTYIIDPKYNPSNQPRMAIGYALAGMMGLLNQAGIIEVKQQEIEQAMQATITTLEECRVAQKTNNNPAKNLALMCVDRRPILVGAEFLIGATHVSANQFNENAKTFVDYKVIPEINHHLMEGLRLPKSNKLDTLFLFFNSNLYHERNQKRVDLTKQAVEKQDIQTLTIDLHAQSKIGQVFELITLMAFANFYLAIINKINPSLVPTVDWFKEQLK
ncbi:MAG: SIS domain-containing protein [Patescibacteria group bacterium]|nr:SIS domain-containing protein [Patescibacteria group bacterium]